MKNRGLNPTLRSMVWMLLVAIGLSSCTVTPRQVYDNVPSFDGSVQNSGVLGIFTSESGEVSTIISATARQRYNALIETYGNRYPIPLTKDAGITPRADGTFLIDAEHDVKAREMNLWRKSESK